MPAQNSDRTLEVLDHLMRESTPRRKKRKNMQQAALEGATPDIQQSEVAPPLPVPNAGGPLQQPKKFV